MRMALAHISWSRATSKAVKISDLSVAEEECDAIQSQREEPTTTGIDAGFDLSPPVDARNEGEVDAWHCFFRAVETEFEDDPKVSFQNGRLVFEAGEHPKLPFDGTSFRRFSASPRTSYHGGASPRTFCVAHALYNQGRPAPDL